MWDSKAVKDSFTQFWAVFSCGRRLSPQVSVSSFAHWVLFSQLITLVCMGVSYREGHTVPWWIIIITTFNQTCPLEGYNARGGINYEAYNFVYNRSAVTIAIGYCLKQKAGFGSPDFRYTSVHFLSTQAYVVPRQELFLDNNSDERIQTSCLYSLHACAMFAMSINKWPTSNNPLFAFA